MYSGININQIDMTTLGQDNAKEPTKFTISYKKTKPIDLEEWAKTADTDINPYKVNNLQQYNPLYDSFFELNDQNYNSISLNHKYHVQNLNTVVDLQTQETKNTPVFVKFSPLLDPIRYMVGKYDVEDEKVRTLPILAETEGHESLPKIKSANNASYIDNFFSFLTSTLLNHHGFQHGLDYYGSYLGIQERFKMNVQDDLEYLNNSDFFTKNIGKLITLENYTLDQEYANFGSRGNKGRLHLSESVLPLDSIIDFSQDTEQTPNKPMTDSELDNIIEQVFQEEKQVTDSIALTLDELVYDRANTSTKTHQTSSSENTSNNSQVNYSTDGSDNEDEVWETESESNSEEEEEEEEDEEDEEEEEEKETFAYIHNFPVQMICLEKCEGTLDELFVKNKINPDNGASALFQIIMMLITYQKAFHFTHNDLHTNNIMYKKTDQEFLYYCYNSTYYKVPTYGYIYKLIDFGRGIYKYQDKPFCSDSFANGGDASTQYNCEPFLNKNKPRLEPNYSFDLCRLGCSIYDFIIEEDMEYKSLDELQKTIWRWCLDDNKKNVLYKKNGEERYPNFKLYKMIARTVHNHTPQEQLAFPFFNQFIVANIDANSCMNIDAIPVYV